MAKLVDPHRAVIAAVLALLITASQTPITVGLSLRDRALRSKAPWQSENSGNHPQNPAIGTDAIVSKLPGCRQPTSPVLVRLTQVNNIIQVTNAHFTTSSHRQRRDVVHANATESKLLGGWSMSLTRAPLCRI